MPENAGASWAPVAAGDQVVDTITAPDGARITIYRSLCGCYGFYCPRPAGCGAEFVGWPDEAGIRVQADGHAGSQRHAASPGVAPC
jgi:hypothetical protein